MPTYQYRCTSCFHITERRQSFDEAPLSECPSCGGSLRRVLNPVGIIFKGSGWYCTDSRGKTESEKSASCDGCTKEPEAAAAKG